MPAHPSPFRSHDLAVREDGARTIIRKAHKRIAELEQALLESLPGTERRKLTLNLSARRNNLRSWEAYVLQGCPREPRATTIP